MVPPEDEDSESRLALGMRACFELTLEGLLGIAMNSSNGSRVFLAGFDLGTRIPSADANPRPTFVG